MNFTQVFAQQSCHTSMDEMFGSLCQCVSIRNLQNTNIIIEWVWWQKLCRISKYIYLGSNIIVGLLMAEAEPRESVGQRGLRAVEHQHARVGVVWQGTTKMGSKDQFRKNLLLFCNISFSWQTQIEDENNCVIVSVVCQQTWPKCNLPDSSTKWFIPFSFTLIFITLFLLSELKLVFCVDVF